MVNGYKKTEMGVVPNDWDVLPFGDVFRTLSNNTLSRDQLNYDSGSIKDIHYGDVLILFPEVLDCSRDDIPYVNDDEPLSCQRLQQGDVIISDTAEDETVGKAVEIANQGDTNIVAGLHTIPCRVKKGRFASGWLGYFINSHYYHDQLLPYIHGTKVSSIARESLADTYIAIPPYDEQKKIVKALTDISELITKSESLVKKYQAIKQGCLQHMFPHKGQKEPDMRLPGFSGTWEQRKVGDYYDFKNGLNKGKEYFGTGTPIVNFTDVFNNRGLISKVLKGKVNLEPSEIRKYEVKKGDIFFTRTSETIEEIGYPSVMLDSPKDTVFSGFVLRGRCITDEDPLDDLFKKYVFFTESFRNEMMHKSSITTRALTSGKSIKNMEFMFPKNKEEQKQIALFLTSLDNLITLHQHECEKYQMIKQGMMEDLLTGKIRLK